MSNRAKFWGLLLLATSLLGCSETREPAGELAGTGAGPDATYLLAERPAEVQTVAVARTSDNTDEEVTVEGRIGGSEKPFVEGIAAFTIVDPAIPHCAADEGCPTPWDYCCEQGKVKEGIATVKVIDPDGKLVSKDARELLGVKELSRVVVRGKAQRDDHGNLTLLADKVHVVKE